MKAKTSATAMTRRDVLRLALAPPFLSTLGVSALMHQGNRNPLNLQTIVKAPSRIVLADDAEGNGQLKLTRRWQGSLCRARLTNSGKKPVRVKEVILFDIALRLAPETRLYGEGFQMLSQTGGTLGQPVNLGNYTDAKHYRMPMPAEAQTAYGMVTLANGQSMHHLLAFTSCHRFIGQFYFRPDTLQVVLDTEGLAIKPGESWELEEFTYGDGVNRETLLRELARRLAENHPPLRTKTPPTGWCSWYCFGAKVTAAQVLDNLDAIGKNLAGLKYIQIDDGYQPAMGDWLETGAAFGGNVQGVLKAIRERGFEPAIWVAPFIAEENSHLFRERPDWFVKDESGKPLRSDRVTFGGWRRGPWYALDGTHPEAQKHLQQVFQTMRRDWGCSYFKLDANFWGAIHGGRFYDPRATRIEAYRRGMQAIHGGAGDAFILGCNHPIWPSFGLLHGSRSSNDIKRSWERIETTARQNLSRNWQNGRLWWNDPDAVVLTGALSDDEFRFHATAIYASGGMILSGDDLTNISAERLRVLKKLLPPTGVSAQFEDDALRVGVMNLPEARMVCLFNWQNKPETISFRLSRPSRISDFWSGEMLGEHRNSFTVKEMPAHSARLLVCR